MLFNKVHIEAVGYHLPDEVLTSAAIEERLAPQLSALGFQPGRLEGLTGIVERRIWPIGTRPSSVAAEAARHALNKGSIKPEEVEFLLHCGVCRDALEPATAAVVHYNLGLSAHCGVLDVSNACLGFLNGLISAANMIELGHIDTALVVSGENAGPIYQDTIDMLQQNPSQDLMRKSLASLTLGSGAVAFVLRHKDKTKTTHRLLGGVTLSDCESHAVCCGNGDIHHQRMETDTQELLRKGLILSAKTWDLFKRRLNWTNETPDHVFNHQVSRVFSDRALEAMGISSRRNYFDCARFGNTGSVAVPLSVAMRADEGELKEGELMALLGIGSGLNCMMLGVQW